MFYSMINIQIEPNYLNLRLIEGEFCVYSRGINWSDFNLLPKMSDVISLPMNPGCYRFLYWRAKRDEIRGTVSF